MAYKKYYAELREFAKENERKIYDFCFFMGVGDELEDVVIEIFRSFGDWYKKHLVKSQTANVFDKKIKLFQLARDVIYQTSLLHKTEFPIGRDTRRLVVSEVDLMRDWQHLKEGYDWAFFVMDRLKGVEIDFRFPLVLRDILGFEDDLVARILELRWGVYRQRLHRGRQECLERFKGRAGILDVGRKTNDMNMA